MSKNIILVDKRVQDYETIVAAIDPALAVGIVFDYYIDTFDSLKTHIDAIGITSDNPTNATAGISVGLVQHNYRSPMFGMVASADLAPVANVAIQDPDLALWTQFRDFIMWCKTQRGAAHFDLMACALYSDPDWKYVIDTLETQTSVTIRASTDDTGAASLGGDWFLESHTGVNLKTVYFTELIEEYRGILFLYPNDIREYSTKGFATGSVQAWGYPTSGATGAPSSVTDANSGVVAVHSNTAAFAALKNNGSVVAWGNSSYGGMDPGISSGVVAVHSNTAAFAALKTDGSVVAWGQLSIGGSAPSTVTNANSGVVAVYSTNYAFAALKTDGSVVAWGNSSNGGSAPSSVTNANSGVVSLYSNDGAFAALKNDGSVVAWGNSSYGGTGAPSSVTAANSGVVAVYSTYFAFAALKTDGSIVAWGPDWGGGSAPSSVTAANSGVVTVYSNLCAFAALKSDGSVVAWGDSSYGGAGAPSSVTDANSGVVAVYSTQFAFAALKTDGSVVAWGDSSYGGTTPGNVSSGVVAVYSNLYAFAALKSEGSVVAWGYPSRGGIAPSSVTNSNSGVVAIYSTGLAFAALKTDSSVVAWGNTDYGGNAPSSVTDANSGVLAVYSTGGAFAALKSTANTFDLNMSYYTDMDRYNILRNKENRRRVNLTTLNNNVFTLSQARDIQSFNSAIPSDKVFRIIVPTYTSSPLSITSSATIPSSYNLGSVIIACDESEPVSISGTTYINYGSVVYTLNASGSYVKTTSATINGLPLPYSLYGGDGINSSGIALLDTRQTSTLTTFTVASSKTYGDASFAITTRPTSNSSGAITYSSSNTAVATIDASGNFITVVGGGDVSFIATQEGTNDYTPTTKTSNTLSVARLAFVSPPTSKNATDLASVLQPGFNEEFTLTATSASSGAVTYTSNNTAIATIGLTTGLVTLMGAGGTLIITASQASTAQYNAINATCSIVINYIDTSLIGQTVSPGTSYAGVDFSGAILTGATLSGVSFSGASLINADLSGVVITGTNFTNANINGAINLPAFSTVQKLQLLGNLNNIAIGAIQINTQVSGADINAMLPLSVSDIASATFTLKMPSALDASSNRNVTITSADISNNTSVYIPLNANQTVKINGTAFFFNGTNILDANNKVRSFLLVEGVPFKLYAGSIIALNITESLNEVKVMDDGLYNIFSALLKPRST